MSNNPVTNAFFFGRALAEVLSEKLEETFTNTMSELGKFDAEQREHLRQFMEEVQLRAEQVKADNPEYGGSSTNSNSSSTSNNFRSDRPEDLQAMLDQLRAEIASLRAELKNYRR
jgi:methyl-accepting chemotaxis protein